MDKLSCFTFISSLGILLISYYTGFIIGKSNGESMYKILTEQAVKDIKKKHRRGRNLYV